LARRLLEDELPQGSLTVDGSAKEPLAVAEDLARHIRGLVEKFGQRDSKRSSAVDPKF
jgi:hypothetical protein